MPPYVSIGFLWFRARLYYSFTVAFPKTGTRSCNYKLPCASMPP